MASSAMLAPAPTHAAGVAHVTGTTALAAAPVKHPFRILVVDDNPINRQMLLRPLRKAGFDCLEACDGLEATRIYAALQPALVLMDITMPVMDGWTATREIRNWELASTLQGNGPQQRARIGKHKAFAIGNDIVAVPDSHFPP